MGQIEREPGLGKEQGGTQNQNGGQACLPQQLKAKLGKFGGAKESPSPSLG